ncbi:MAG: glycosyltransferase family 4 protein [Patescibacteria group bacterium]
MKIAQIVSLEESVPPKHKNGLEFVVSWITEELIKRGHDVTLFAPADSKTKAKLVPLVSVCLSNQDNKTQNWKQPQADMWNSALVAAQSGNFDIIHSHSRSIVYFMSQIKIPVVQTLHHPASFHHPFFDNEIGEANLRFILDHYSKINYVSVSKNQLNEYLGSKSSYFKNYTNIYNGIPINDFEFNNNPNNYLFFIGYINKNKGADIAVRVAKKMGMNLILAGDNSTEIDFFKKEIEPYLNDKIKYVGPVDFKKKNELYKNALATLAPIRWQEPFGLTIVESQACGTPVISFRNGAAPEIIDHGNTGFVVENEEQMIEAVSKIKTIDRKKCREWVEKNFSVETMVDGYEALYRKLTNKK